MYLIASLVVAFGISVFAVSKIAHMLHAKKPGMERVFLASLIGGIAAFATAVALSALVKNLDPMVMVLVSVLSMLIVSSLAFKTINQMSWGGAITTNIANVALVLMTSTIAIVLNGESIQETVQSVHKAFNTNAVIVENLASGNTDIAAISDDIEKKVGTDDEALAAEDEEVEDTPIREKDLLPAAAVKELEAKKKVVYKAPKFRVISLDKVRSAVGKSVRVKNKSGRRIVGALRKIDGNDLVIEQRINGGVAITPVSVAKIKTIEVYR